MPSGECTEVLAGWEGYEVGAVKRWNAGEQGPKAEVWIELKQVRDRVKYCSGCFRRVGTVHDVTERWIRDLPILDAETWLLVQRCRVDCSHCGPTLELIAWLDRYSRVTKRLAENVAKLCMVLPIKQVAEFFGLGWDTVKGIDKAHLQRTVAQPDLSDLEVIAMDEFAIQRGHQYATIIVEPYRKQVLWVGRGRGREDIRPFFEMLGSKGCRRLRAVVMDMHGAYVTEVRACCPNAEIIYDLFHVIAKYSREVIDRVRVDEANRVRHDQKARKVIKGSRWLLLRNRENITNPQDRVRLDELLKANRRLCTVYVLKDDLKHLWDYESQGWAHRFWNQWYSRAIRSRIEPLKTFARRLKQYLHGILAHCHWPLHTSLLEGINNKIKVIKRMAYGFRDDEYFFLKIRAAFPGNAG